MMASQSVEGGGSRKLPTGLETGALTIRVLQHCASLWLSLRQ
jgi:hypothetical protein